MKVFLSHTSKDKFFADKLKRQLIEHKIEVWSYEETIKPGESLIGTIKAGIEEADHFLIILSAGSNQSEFMMTEIALVVSEAIKNTNKRIIPILIDRKAEMPFFLRDLQYIDLSAEAPYEENLANLIDTFQLPGCPVPDKIRINKARVEYIQKATEILNNEKETQAITMKEKEHDTVLTFLQESVKLMLTFLIIVGSISLMRFTMMKIGTSDQFALLFDKIFDFTKSVVFVVLIIVQLLQLIVHVSIPSAIKYIKRRSNEQ